MKAHDRYDPWVKLWDDGMDELASFLIRQGLWVGPDTFAARLTREIDGKQVRYEDRGAIDGRGHVAEPSGYGGHIDGQLTKNGSVFLPGTSGDAAHRCSKPPMTTSRAYVMHPDDAPGFWQLGDLWRVMATGVQTGTSFCLLDQLVTPDGGGPCTHTHAQDEGLYVVSGHCTFNAGGLTVAAPASSFASVPHRTEHSFTVDAPGTQLLNFYLPAGRPSVMSPGVV